MSDFLVQFGEMDTQRITRVLRDRPGMADAPIHAFTFPWGSVIVQEPRGRGYVPFEQDGDLFACVARPRFMGVTHEDHGPDGFNRLFAERWRRGDRKQLFDALTGMYALVRCHESGVDVLTDQMGFQPVYMGAGRSPGGVAMGSFGESVYAAVDRQLEFDLVSLAEVLIYGYPTFPFTTRHGVSQLAPATLHSICLRGSDCTHHEEAYWIPEEPSEWPTSDQLLDEFVPAFRQGVEDITRSACPVATTLSGGIDSRAVLAAVPRDRDPLAITYATRRNQELLTAKQVARAHGVRHMIAWRPKEYFADLAVRGVQLLGLETSFPVQGLCIFDDRLHKECDLILTGTLADGFYKDASMPARRKETLRPKRLPERLKTVALRLAGCRVGKDCTRDWRDNVHKKSFIADPILEAVEERRRERLRALEALVPTAADEWILMWPSCQNNAHLLGNCKLFNADGPFMYRKLIDIVPRIPPSLKYNGRLANRALLHVCGPLGAIVNAKTGLPANIGLATTKRWLEPKTFCKLTPSEAPWNDVQHSWVNYELLQKLSPRWTEFRQLLAGSAALDVLAPILKPDVRAVIEGYAEPMESNLNYAIMRMALYIHHACRGRVGDDGCGVSLEAGPQASERISRAHISSAYGERTWK